MPSLFTHPIHLDAASGAQVQPEFSGMAWYADYMARTAEDGAKGRLVSLSTFTESWTSWEMHPAGDEVVVARDNMPLLKLVPLTPTGGRRPGSAKGQVRMAADFDAPLPDFAGYE